MPDNPFDIDPDDDEATDDAPPEPKQDNQSAAAQRKLAKAEKELAELRAFKVEREQADRRNAVTSVFTEVGLNPKWAGFYSGDDSSPEAIKAWAIEQEFIQPAEGETPAPVPSTGYTPTVIPDATISSAKTFTVSEFRDLARVDPQAAERAFNEGRVNMAAARSGLGPDK